MKIKFLAILVIFLLPLPVRAQTAEEIVKKYLNARGGLDKIRAIQSERISGHIAFSPDLGGPFLLEFKRPLKMHMEATIQGRSLIRVYDGKSAGWVINPFDENKGTQPMSADDLSNISDESDFDGPLVDYQAKGNQIELAGKDDIDGKPVYKLKLTRKNGDERVYYIDTASFLVLKWDGVTHSDGKAVPMRNFLHDYRDVDGLKFPFEIDTGFPGSPEQRQFTIEKVELNPQIDDSRFAKPVPPSTPADPPAKPSVPESPPPA
jgi:outer membrane lipoprotein-sorting protein